MLQDLDTSSFFLTNLHCFDYKRDCSLIMQSVIFNVTHVRLISTLVLAELFQLGNRLYILKRGFNANLKNVDKIFEI